MKKVVALISTFCVAVTFSAAPFLIVQVIPSVSITSPVNTLYEKRINASGTIESREMKQIYLDTPVIAQSVNVSVGDYVKKNQILATIDTDLTQTVLSESVSASALLDVPVTGQDLAELAGLYTAIQSAGLGAGLDETLSSVAKDYIGAGDTSSVKTNVYIPKTINSPMNGIVTQIGLQNDVLSQTSKPILTISDTSQFIAMVTVGESNVGEISEGDTAIITGTGFSDRVYMGHVKKIYPVAHRSAASPASETVVDLEIAIDNADQELKSGFTVRAEIVTNKCREMLTVPYESVLQDENNVEYVYTVKDSKAIRKNIQTGLELSDGVEVCSGLELSDMIVLDASMINENDGRIILKRSAEGNG